jgi:hypothetical protein
MLMKPLLLQVRVLTAAVSVIFLIASAAASEATVDLTVGKICFLRNGWVFIKDLATGKETKLVEGGSARLAPTGDSIVFISITEQDPFMASLVAPPGRLRVLTLKTMKAAASTVCGRVEFRMPYGQALARSLLLDRRTTNARLRC